MTGSPAVGANAVPVLRVRGVSKRFGTTVALDGVDLEVRAGRVLALIGENGAGKSTLIKILGGAHPPDAGSLELEGRRYAPQGPDQARRAGVGIVHQEPTLAPDLSVEDNIMLGREEGRRGLLLRGPQRRRVREVLARLGHPDLRPETPVRSLSPALGQLVEIARALVSEARVLVFDEPTSSLGGDDAARLFRVIRGLRDAGIGIVYVSHFLEEIRQVCDDWAVLRDGRSVGAGCLADVSPREIVSLMVGRTVEDLFPVVPHAPGETLLTVEGLSGRRAPHDVSLHVRRGEILGIAGLVGSGRTELLRCLFGLDAVRSGRVKVGTVEPLGGPARRIAAGLGFVSEDRKSEGLALGCSIADNATWSRLAPYARHGWLDLGRRDAAVADWMRRLAVKARGPGQPVGQLSGGNQQKVALIRVLHQGADVLLLDEPTRGIDVGTKAEIYRLMGTLAAEGKAILFVSSYLPELLAVCDRVAVLSRGRLRAVRAAADWTEEEVLAEAVATGT